MNLTLDDRCRMVIALEVAAYMRWVETRRHHSPNNEMIDACIQGVLDREGLGYSSDEIQAIAILATTFNLDLVHSFIESSGIFNDFDQADNEIKNGKKT